MRGKLMFHYAMSFIVACSVIVLLNVVFMWNSIYRIGGLYNFHPEDTIKQFEKYIELESNGKLILNKEGLSSLAKENIGIQLLNEHNEEVFAYNKPKGAPTYYSNVALIDMYNHREVTLIVEEVEIEGIDYTYLLFFDGNKIKRSTFVYDAKLVGKAHKFPTLILLNITLLLVMSFLFTMKLTKPVHRIIAKILALSNGDYKKNTFKRGIYFDVEKRLNLLGDKLRSNAEEHVKLEKMREEWISNISHDIKTPLTSIMGNAEIMSDTDYEITESIRTKCCNTILRKSEYIKSLVDDLNLSTRLKNDTLVLHKKKVNIVSLVRHVAIDLMNDEKYKDSRLKFKYEVECIYLNLDESLIKRVFINLITNAFVHNDEEVSVEVHVYKEDNQVCITIEDDGKGVLKEELDNIFNRYYRGTHTGKKIEGSGLGMAIAHDIIKIHNGKISTTSEIGKGLKIKIVLESE